VDWDPRWFARSAARAAVIAIYMIPVAVIATGIILWWDSEHQTLPQASCGRVITHQLDSDTQLYSPDPAALACFSTAAQECTDASITVTAMGVDAGINYVFILKPGRTPCPVTELSQSYGGPAGSTGPVTSLPCRITTVTARAVNLSCGGQDVLIPAAATAL
jgi:hypothetical protein